MSNKLNDYDRLVDLIGGIIKLTSEPDEQEDIDKAIDTAHRVGEVADVLYGNKQENR